MSAGKCWVLSGAQFTYDDESNRPLIDPYSGRVMGVPQAVYLNYSEAETARRRLSIERIKGAGLCDFGSEERILDGDSEHFWEQYCEIIGAARQFKNMRQYTVRVGFKSGKWKKMFANVEIQGNPSQALLKDTLAYVVKAKLKDGMWGEHSDVRGHAVEFVDVLDSRDESVQSYGEPWNGREYSEWSIPSDLTDEQYERILELLDVEFYLIEEVPLHS